MRCRPLIETQATSKMLISCRSFVYQTKTKTLGKISDDSQGVGRNIPPGTPPALPGLVQSRGHSVKKILLLACSSVLVAACGGYKGVESSSSKIYLSALKAQPQLADDFPCSGGEASKKVLICHIPPGNPDNKHTICIGKSAVQGHIDHHGDYLGECDSGDSDDGDDGENSSSSDHDHGSKNPPGDNSTPDDSSPDDTTPDDSTPDDNIIVDPNPNTSGVDNPDET